jgi:hypothetical protein
MIAIYIEREMGKFRYEIEYTFECMLRTLGYEYKFISRLNQIRKQDVVLYYGLIEPNVTELRTMALCGVMIYIPAEPEFFRADRTLYKDLDACRRTVQLLHSIPVLSRRSFDAPVNVLVHDDLYYGIYNFDLLSNTFYHLAALDERVKATRDELHRLPDAEDSFIEYSAVPYVNELFWMFEQFLTEAVSHRNDVYLVKRTAWPQDEPYAVGLSHSISRLQRWTVGGFMKDSLIDWLHLFNIKRFIRETGKKWLYLATNDEQYWTFETIIALEEQYAVTSSWLWGTTKRDKKKRTLHDVDYTLDDTDISEMIQRQCKEGHDVSLLASEMAYRDDVLEGQKRDLMNFTQRNQMGVRHPLRRSNPEKTVEYHNRYNFVYDSTIGFIDQTGFKHGIAFPYYQFTGQVSDAPNRMPEFRKNNCLQIPIHLFDQAFRLSAAGCLSYSKAQERVCELIDAVMPLKGLVCCDFSPHNFAEIPYLKELYASVLEQISQQKAFVKPLKDIALWWKRRNAVVIKEKRHELEIYFPDDLEHFTLQVFGFPRCFQVVDTTTEENEQLRLFTPGEALSVENTSIRIEGTTLYFSTILADTRIRIKLDAQPEEPGDE